MNDENAVGDYQFEDADTAASGAGPSGRAAGGQSGGSTRARSGDGGSYANELYSKRIDAKFRTFFIDLKESVNGKFIKISEKSRGRKSTIMMDAEDVPAMIEALKEVATKF